MQTIKVKLAGKEYELKPLPIRRAREVRQRFSVPVGQVIAALKSAPTTNLSDVNALGELLDAVKLVLMESMDLCLEALFDFSPALAADRERIENEGFDDEALNAFMEVVKMLYPFGGVLQSMNGLVQSATSMNLPLANGGAGRTK
jgi:hypothetical protein